VTEWVLDASAVLAFLVGEPGGDRLDQLPPEDCALGAVNLAEVVSKLVERGLARGEVDDLLVDLRFVTVDFDRELAIVAGRLRAPTRRFGLSLGDRACLALGARLGLPVLTTDRRWTELDVGVEVIAIR
jgi:PIN domain nuclease of toxin-antitoxin system